MFKFIFTVFVFLAMALPSHASYWDELFQSPNACLCGPASGGNATATFRSLQGADLPAELWNENAQTGSTYTFSLTDGSGNNNYPYVSFNNMAGVSVTVPTNASVAFPVGTHIPVINAGTGPVSINPASGVTINSVNGYTTLLDQFTEAELIKKSTNTWYLIGAFLSQTFLSASCTSCSVSFNGNYEIFTFNGSTDPSDNFVINSGSGTVNWVIQGGGGGGGAAAGGGGGAGQYQTGSASLSSGTFAVVAGTGGSAGTLPNTDGGSGTSSSFHSNTSVGGGGGGSNNFNGVNGASGGGGGGNFVGTTSGGTGSAGNNGGTGSGSSNDAAGGGGGSGSVGGNGVTSTGTGGGGGTGTGVSIAGLAAQFFGAGGGGGAQNGTGTGGTGGSSIGGNGSASNGSAGSAGSAHTGSGGGGGSTGSNGGAGADGSVVLWWQYQT